MFGFETLGKLAVEKSKFSVEKFGGKMARRGREIHFMCDDKSFDETVSVIKIECCLECPVFVEKAQEIFKILSEKFTRNKFHLLLNQSEVDGSRVKPRDGAFEISFAKNCRRAYHVIWTGIDKGPPRRDKFPPNLDDLERQMQKILVTG